MIKPWFNGHHLWQRNPKRWPPIPEDFEWRGWYVLNQSIFRTYFKIKCCLCFPTGVLKLQVLSKAVNSALKGHSSNNLSNSLKYCFWLSITVPWILSTEMFCELFQMHTVHNNEFVFEHVLVYWLHVYMLRAVHPNILLYTSIASKCCCVFFFSLVCYFSVVHSAQCICFRKSRIPQTLQITPVK